MPTSKPIPKHDHATLTFPKDFLWGAATSAHQVEGNNIHNDWWDWENKGKIPPSGEACDQYHRYEEDFDLVKSLNHNAHRLSLEWSRIEPEEGKFDQNEIDHYKSVLKALKDRGITVMLTLHHWTNPLWFAKKGGWENRKSSYYFERFIKTIAPQIKDYVDIWITINEPGIYVWHMYIDPQFPNSKKGLLGQIKTYRNFALAHKKAYQLLHKITPKKPVGIAQNVQSYSAYHKHSVIEQLGVIVSDVIANHGFYLLTKGYHDFLGVNYYFHHRLKREGLFPKEVDVSGFTRDVSDLGWEIFPEGIFDVLTDLADGLPIYITECGIAASNDDRRIRFLMQYLQEVYRAIQAGVDVRGFFYWSLLDNYEWFRGFGPRFGLVEVDYQTQKRLLRPSALIYADIIKHNGIRHELMKFLGHRVHVSEVLKIPK
ncbi:MAG: glycoside hydrolase family 1 protein [Patescibacteria group bacterium]|nr:glycoside hydrolase family 1 protein [Patescibacteria group bacterium]